MKDDFPDVVSRSILYEGPLALAARKLEAKMGIPISEIPWSKFIGPSKTETIAIDPALIQVKAMDTVIRGAETVTMHDKAAKIVEMTAPKQEQPLMAYDAFTVYHGTHGAKLRRSGGNVDRVELDCSNDRGLHRVEIALRKTWIRDQNFGAVEESLSSAGMVMYDEIFGDVVAEYETDVNSAMTDTVANWGNGHYKALLWALGLVAAQKMYPSVAFVNPTEIYDLGISDYFIHGEYTSKAGSLQLEPQNGLLGYLMPNRIPIYFHHKVTTAKMTIAAAQKAVILGIRQPLQIENFNDVLQGLEGAVLTMQWDTKSGNDAKTTKPTQKSWAVISGA